MIVSKIREREIPYDCSYTRNLKREKINKLIDAKSRLVIASSGGGRNGQRGSMGKNEKDIFRL